MKLVRFGGLGLNIDSITDWDSRPDSPRDTLEIRFVGGTSLTFWDEQAVAFREWLERNSDNAVTGT